MLRLWKRKPGTPLSQEELQQRRDAAEASAAKRRGQGEGRSSLDLFRSEIRRIPMLDAEQERDLLSRWSKDKDPKARDKILAAHLRMSFASARKLSGYGMPIEDLVAAGNIGLMQALERYDPEQAGGARFATFAQKYMTAAQLAHVQNSWSIVRMGTNRDQKRLFFKLREDLRQAGDFLDDNAAEEIARKRGVKVAAVREMAARFTGRDTSLNQSLGDDGEGDELVDRLVGGSEHAELTLARKQQETLRRAALSRAMAALPERQRRIFAARNLRQPPATLQQISSEMGISAERVRQIEAQAFTTLRQSVAKDPRLNKRTPGAPLSDAEREQRRNAARARWQKWSRIFYRGAPTEDRSPIARDYGAVYLTRRPNIAFLYALTDNRGNDLPGGRVSRFVLPADAKIGRKGSPFWRDLELISDEARRLGSVTRVTPSILSLAREHDLDAISANDGMGWMQHELVVLRPEKLRFIGSKDRFEKSASGYFLAKRTPGAPLSDAEREQRRNAALARWAAAGAGAAIGAGVAEGAVRGGAKLASRWLTAKDEKAPRRARRLAALRRELRLGQIERTAEARYRAAGKPFNREPEAEKGRPGPITQRMRDLRALKARGPKQLAALDARLTELQDAFERGDTPKPGLGWREATIARERLRDDLARVDGELAELSQQTPATKKVVQVHRGAAGLFSSPEIERDVRPEQYKRKVASSIPPEGMRRIRVLVRERGEEKAQNARDFVAARWKQAIPGFAAKLKDRTERGLAHTIRGKWRAPALAAGALVGAGAGAWAANRLGKLTPPQISATSEPLAKVAPDDGWRQPDLFEDMASTPAANEEEKALAARLAEMFRGWLKDPQRTGNRADVERALDPLYGILRAGMDAVPPPPGETDMLPRTPEARELGVNFDMRSAVVERRLREYALDRIRAITQESRDAIRATLIDAAQRGLPVQEQARRIRESVGLSPGQQDWVSSYRASLEALDPRVLGRELRDRRFDGPIRRAIEAGQPLAAEDIDRYVEAYQRRTLAYRALTIARTESLRAANTGMVEGARELLNEHQDLTVEKVWIATKDSRTRDAHRELDGKRVIGMDVPFEIRNPRTGQIEQIRWPHDPQAPASHTVNCRCTFGIRLIPKPGAGRFTAEAA